MSRSKCIRCGLSQSRGVKCRRCSAPVVPEKGASTPPKRKLLEQERLDEYTSRKKKRKKF